MQAGPRRRQANQPPIEQIPNRRGAVQAPMAPPQVMPPGQAYYAPNVQRKPLQQNPFMQANKPKPKKRFTKRIMALLLVLNLIAVVALLIFNGLIIAKRASEESAKQRVINRHPLYYKESIITTAMRYNLHAAYVSAIINRESSFQPDARSNVGALGLMQVMPETAEWIAGKLKDSNYHFEKLAEPAVAIEYGCWYLQFLSNRFHGDPVLTTAAYHAGQGQVANWLKNPEISPDGKTIPMERFPEGPTKTYVKRVLDSYAIYKKLFFETP
ncbi:MAG: lytic transglycosylase domain-containing protein [Eubacteriales bacterium]|nr:lytic transglycosylase domain-containing protein [Eubacteriales bacterium]